MKFSVIKTKFSGFLESFFTNHVSVKTIFKVLLYIEADIEVSFLTISSKRLNLSYFQYCDLKSFSF